MAEFYYFGTKQEFISLLQSALHTGYNVQINNDLTVPIPEFCENENEIETLVGNKQYAFLLTRPDITRYPVGIMNFTRAGASLWAARPRHGGPSIEVYFWAPYEKDGKRIIPCWLLTYNSKIISPNTNQFEAAGSPMKSAFNKIIGSLRKNARRIKGRNGTAYVSSGVEAMLAAGWRLSSQYDDEIQ